MNKPNNSFDQSAFLDMNRRRNFTQVFLNHKRPWQLMAPILMLRENQMNSSEEAKWGRFVRDDIEYWYQEWLKETLAKVQAKKEGKQYKIDYLKLFGEPYNK